ncbi:MAG TPA: V-type ATPase 116kDa subunit family protein, partial [Bacillota bacterium]|nr:V-type ATPase 116kDa subunit family protein [Bacillota bacterium]
MAIVKMKKATMIALQSEKNEILNDLQRFGYLQVVNLEERMEQGFEELQPDSDNEAVGRLEAKLSQVKYSIDFLGKFNTAKKPLFAQKVQVDETKRKEYLDNEEKLNEIYESCRSIDSRFTEIKSSETKLNNAIAQLTPWLALKEKLEEIGTTHNTNSILGFIASKYEDELSTAVKDEDLTAYLEKVGVEKENSYFMVIYHQTCEERISQLLKQVGWTKVTFSEYSGTPEENINRIKAEISNLENIKKELAKKAEAMVPESGFLEILYDLLSIEKDRRSVVKDFIKTDKTFMLQGWIPEKFADDMTKLLDGITDKYTISFEDPSEEDEIPVLLNNPKAVKPYEMITDLYSVPNAKGIDPNIFMAPFFVVFFGIMVTDAVYGILMSALTGYVLYKYKPQGGMKNMMWIMFFGGISTFFWGGIFGGWLGDLIKVKPWWFNPLDEPLKMLIFCLILGVIHLYTGYILQAYQNIKAGNFMDAIYDQV